MNTLKLFLFIISILFRNDFKNMLFQSKFVGSRSNINLDFKSLNFKLYTQEGLKRIIFGYIENILIELR